MTQRFVRELPFGATLVAPDRTRFRIWAPDHAAITLALGDGREIPMKSSGAGLFEIEAACGAGTLYRYRLPTGLLVPDPASRSQPEDVHGPSEVVDPHAYAWRQTTWRGRPWHEAVIYELHVGLCGGFAGVQARLPELAAIGITVIELMPVNDFPGQRNWGYDGVLPFAPDRAYGTPDELKALVDAAHAHGLMITLDVVYNHFGPDGNYLGSYASPFFRHDTSTPWGGAIDFRRPEVRRFFTENVLYWLMEYRFDGLRFDAVHAIADPSWLDEMAAEVRRTVEIGRHVHLVLENDDNSAAHLRSGFDAQWNDDAHHVLHLMLTGESDGYYSDYADAPATRLARCLGQGFDYQGEVSVHRGGKRRGSTSADLPPTCFVLFLQNHDQVGNRPFGDRLITQVDDQALRAAVSLQLLCPHIPMLFMGEEQGASEPFQFFTDHHGELAAAVREGRRREFGYFRTFADIASDIPDPNALATFERCRLPPDRDNPQWTGFYRQLLRVRHAEIVPRLPGMRTAGADVISDAGVIASWVCASGDVLTIATNLGTSETPLRRLSGALLFESRRGAGGRAIAGYLPGYSTVGYLGPLS